MSGLDRHHHHHHHAGHIHPAAPIHASILRLSLAQRLVWAVGLVVLIWTATIWSMQ